jgi:hypothetical protein
MVYKIKSLRVTKQAPAAPQQQKKAKVKIKSII